MNYIRDALLAFVVATGALFLFARLGGAVALIGANLGAIIALVFLYIPHWYARKQNLPVEEFGWRWEPVRRGILWGVAFPVLIVLPLFTLGYIVFYQSACAPSAGVLAKLVVPGACSQFTGFSGAEFPALSWGFAEFVLAQFIVVALPEELFFRGFIHELLERRFPAKLKILGGGIGVALLLSSLLFAASHLVVFFDARRLAVFFPALIFGWMRSATGSILAGTLAHALSNIGIRLLDGIFLGVTL